MRLPVVLLLLGSVTAAASAATGVLGDWKTTTGSIVRIAPCSSSSSPIGLTSPSPTNASAVCLTLVQLSPAAPETTDRQNPDASLRGRSLCGLTIGAGFHEDDPAHLSDGHIYDPKSGHTYKGTIALDGTDLKLHGYIGIALFGRTEIWHRAAAVTGCR